MRESGSPKRFAVTTSPVASSSSSAAPIEASSPAKYGCSPGISGSAAPASTPSSAFSSASGSVRPIPSASPTARISVPSALVLPGNFAKSKRGAFTAT